ncbi:hypothetical protein [Acinetobacter tianfuensis]|uniref:Uncharacterized protein n=1 Tax=Acinetobacter tianfuensis TaxID=2419603 RepID=A0A3A8EG92_9GAMM|nr:hypothetical protein [Acinetobacter tianfuensis]RKG33952.1 hypothetical protein D7V32_01480 [Acinetobacter tianfuensis]
MTKQLHKTDTQRIKLEISLLMNTLNTTQLKITQLNRLIFKLEQLMVDIKNDDLLHTYRRTINLEIASAITELLDTKAIIFALYPNLIPQDPPSSFNHAFYKKYVQKNIPVKNWDNLNTLLTLYTPSKEDIQLSLFTKID